MEQFNKWVADDGSQLFHCWSGKFTGKQKEEP